MAAQNRPPPQRLHTTPSATTSSSPPPLSPRGHTDKRHHSRRKSGRSENGNGTAMSTSERKTSSSRPSTTLTRKSTPQYVTKVSSSTRHREKEDKDEERGRDSGESFPQFCMSCEKQFLPANNTFLYCSESCRIHDHNPPTPSRTSSYPGPQNTSPPLSPYGLHFPTSHEDGPDIIPRFSPTQSRPRSYFSSDPYPSSYQAPSALSASVPHPTRYSHNSSRDEKKSTTTRKTGGSSSALESLREIAGALPKASSSSSSSKDRKGSKDSHNHESTNSSAVWGYIPFTSSSNNTPINSYTQPSYNVSQSQSYGRDDVQLYSYGNATSGNVSYSSVQYASTGGMGMDRPLPPRSGPGGYGHRPKSIDLVTPFSSGH